MGWKIYVWYNDNEYDHFVLPDTDDAFALADQILHGDWFKYNGRYIQINPDRVRKVEVWDD